LTCLEQYLHWNELPLDVSSAQSLLQILVEMYNKMVAACQACLTEGGDLMDMLKQLKTDDNPDRHKVTNV